MKTEPICPPFPGVVALRREVEVMRLVSDGVDTPSRIVRRVGFTRHAFRILRLLCDLADRDLVVLLDSGGWKLTAKGYALLAELGDDVRPESAADRERMTITGRATRKRGH